MGALTKHFHRFNPGAPLTAVRFNDRSWIEVFYLPICDDGNPGDDGGGGGKP